MNSTGICSSLGEMLDELDKAMRNWRALQPVDPFGGYLHRYWEEPSCDGNRQLDLAAQTRRRAASETGKGSVFTVRLPSGGVTH